MRRIRLAALMPLLLTVSAPAGAQSFQTDGAIQTSSSVSAGGVVQAGGNVETDGQLVSRVAPGTPPLVVSSTTLIPGLNADLLGGLHSSELAKEADLQNAETLLMALQGQFDGLGRARMRRSGQSNCYGESGSVISCVSAAGVGQDGHLQLGVDWPNPRFTDNGDGTVTDNLTSLVWLKKANCEAGRLKWLDALAFARTLFDGSTDHNGGDCELSDGSVAGQWRLPNPVEIQSLMHYGFDSPAIPDTAGTGKWSVADPFTGVLNDYYWTGTTVALFEGNGWLGYVGDGTIRHGSKFGQWRVWPVRDLD